MLIADASWQIESLHFDLSSWKKMDYCLTIVVVVDMVIEKNNNNVFIISMMMNINVTSLSPSKLIGTTGVNGHACAD